MNGPKGLEWVRVGVLLREGNCSPLAREKSVLEALTPLNPSPPPPPPPPFKQGGHWRGQGEEGGTETHTWEESNREK